MKGNKINVAPIYVPKKAAPLSREEKLKVNSEIAREQTQQSLGKFRRQNVPGNNMNF